MAFAQALVPAYADNVTGSRDPINKQHMRTFGKNIGKNNTFSKLFCMPPLGPHLAELVLKVHLQHTEGFEHLRHVTIAAFLPIIAIRLLL